MSVSIKTATAKNFFSANQQMAVQEEAIQNTFQAWIAAMCSGTAESITALYLEDAILLPTFSPKVHHSAAMRQTYFEAIAALKNLKITVEEQYIRLFGDFAVNSGMYTFSHDVNGKRVIIPARFTFAYEKTPQGWFIVEHHSSQLTGV